MDYFDLHCDTLTELYKNGFRYSDAPLHISGKYRNLFGARMQVSAVWTDKRLDDEAGFRRFCDVLSYAKNDAGYGTEFEFCTDGALLSRDTPKTVMILAVEDCRIAASKEERIDRIYEYGVRVITPVWMGNSCVGGAYDTENGATDFGRLLIRRCIKLGITLDVSHASRILTDEIISAGERKSIPVIASHSNSLSVCPHPRNLSDDSFGRIRDIGGIVGISLAPQHLSITEKADSDDIIRHIDRYLSLGGENTVCLGCDFDGIDSIPTDVQNEGDIPYLYERLAAEFGHTAADKISYKNALSFFTRTLK